MVSRWRDFILRALCDEQVVVKRARNFEHYSTADSKGLIPAHSPFSSKLCNVSSIVVSEYLRFIKPFAAHIPNRQVPFIFLLDLFCYRNTSKTLSAKLCAWSVEGIFLLILFSRIVEFLVASHFSCVSRPAIHNSLVTHKHRRSKCAYTARRVNCLHSGPDGTSLSTAYDVNVSLRYKPVSRILFHSPKRCKTLADMTWVSLLILQTNLTVFNNLISATSYEFLIDLKFHILLPTYLVTSIVRNQTNIPYTHQ